MKTLTTDFLDAKPIILPYYQKIAFYLIGCGGNGSWLATTLCRITNLLNQKNKPTQLTFIDPDVVEEKNLICQNFCAAEINLKKAQTLALRYSAAWGIEISAIPQEFNSNLITRDHQTLTILIGCVDNSAARQSIATALEDNQSYYRQASYIWWLDCGNHAIHPNGQVLLGSHCDLNPDTYQLSELGCIHLPSPSIQHPELLIPQPEELSNHNLSCEELILRNTQYFGINQRVAVEAGEYLIQLITGKLKRFATYFDLASGSSQSIYTTQASILKAIKS